MCGVCGCGDHDVRIEKSDVSVEGKSSIGVADTLQAHSHSEVHHTHEHVHSHSHVDTLKNLETEHSLIHIEQEILSKNSGK